MPLTPTSFRWLLGINFLFLLLTILSVFFDDYILPAELAAYRQAKNDAELSTMEFALMILILPLFFANLASFVGLMLLQNWGRLTYLVTTVVSCLLTPFFGADALSGLSCFSNDTYFVLTGAVIAASYCSPLFARPQSGPPPLPQ